MLTVFVMCEGPTASNLLFINLPPLWSSGLAMIFRELFPLYQVQIDLHLAQKEAGARTAATTLRALLQHVLSGRLQGLLHSLGPRDFSSPLPFEHLHPLAGSPSLFLLYSCCLRTIWQAFSSKPVWSFMGQRKQQRLWIQIHSCHLPAMDLG